MYEGKRPNNLDYVSKATGVQALFSKFNRRIWNNEQVYIYFLLIVPSCIFVASFQIMLPEAIAIVMAPTDTTR